MALKSSDLQSDSDLDSIRNSCDVFSSHCRGWVGGDLVLGDFPRKRAVSSNELSVYAIFTFFSYGDLKPNCGLLVFIVVCSFKSISQSIRFFKARLMSKINLEDKNCKSWSRARGELILS